MSNSNVLTVRSFGLGRFLSCGAIAAALLVLGGCADKRVVQVDASNFQKEVLECDQPVLVDFDKDGCPTCLPVNAISNTLAKEYEGRAKIAHFKIMTAYWTFPSWETKQKYGIYYVPTVILFDQGQEVKRWNMNYSANAYRQALDAQLVNRPTTASSSLPATGAAPTTKIAPTPSPAPKASPSPTPKASPAPTAKPSPSPSPKAAPTATPKATPSPKAGQPDLIP